MNFTTCRSPLYYDLIKIPHGHIPAPKVKFWNWLPIPIIGKRDSNTFQCPECGRPSFFKVYSRCQYCEYGSIFDDSVEDLISRDRRERWRSIWKKIEYIFLPFLVLFGKAYYLRSVRYHVSDYKRGVVN